MSNILFKYNQLNVSTWVYAYLFTTLATASSYILTHGKFTITKKQY